MISFLPLQPCLLHLLLRRSRSLPSVVTPPFRPASPSFQAIVSPSPSPWPSRACSLLPRRSSQVVVPLLPRPARICRVSLFVPVSASALGVVPRKRSLPAESSSLVSTVMIRRTLARNCVTGCAFNSHTYSPCRTTPRFSPPTPQLIWGRQRLTPRQPLMEWSTGLLGMMFFMSVTSGQCGPH